MEGIQNYKINALYIGLSKNDTFSIYIGKELENGSMSYIDILTKATKKDNNNFLPLNYFIDADSNKINIKQIIKLKNLINKDIYFTDRFDLLKEKLQKIDTLKEDLLRENKDQMDLKF